MEFELMEFKTHDAKPIVGTSPQYTPVVGYELSKLPVASSPDADKTLLTARLPATAASPCTVALVWLRLMRSEPLILTWVAKPLDVKFNVPPTVIGPEHVACTRPRGCANEAPVSPIWNVGGLKPPQFAKYWVHGLHICLSPQAVLTDCRYCA